MQNDDITVKNALLEGGIFTKLSFIIMGFGNIIHKQFIKGFIFFFWEVTYIIFMLMKGIDCLIDLFNLGGEQQGEVWNEAKGIYEYTKGDNSLLMLLYGVIVLFVTACFVVTWIASVKSAYKAEVLTQNNEQVNSFVDDLRSLFDENLQNLLLTGPVVGIILFNIIPLVFMILMAFTNYTMKTDNVVIFNWVGFDNFIELFQGTNDIGQQFFPVLGWTLIWAFMATILNYFLGTMVALLINRKTTVGKKFWRSCLVVTLAIPQFVSLLAVRQMLAINGPVNVFLLSNNFVDKAIPFLSNVTWARITVIVVNLWVGIPFTMLQMTGILNNIPMELYESAKIDGAGKVKIFFKITFPYMLFVTAPYLITTFSQNVNNFNVIYLLTGGAPNEINGTAGKTDLLVTWLYKLTIDKKYYNEGAVIGICAFVVLAVVSLIMYRNTNSYQDEEGFQQ